MLSDFLHESRERGFLYQATQLEDLNQRFLKEQVSGYIGFDATATSLQVGNLVAIMWLRLLQKCGHKPIVVIGGATSKIGDPSFRDESRKLLDENTLNLNINGIKDTFNRFLDNPLIINNDDWLKDINYIDFLRDIGSHFSINRMLSFDSVKLRLDREQSLSFLEFNYMILQAFDFLQINKKYGCILQMGGSDQWGNIINGVELVRKIAGCEVFGLTAPLITTANGAKMGKTARGAIWLNQELLSAYDYWQFWRNTHDADVIRYLKIFTDLKLEEISKMANLQGAELNSVKIILADEATKLAHGAESLPGIHHAISNLFDDKASSFEHIPTIILSEISSEYLDDILVYAKLLASKGEVKRLIQGKGLKINDQVIDDIKEKINLQLLAKEPIKVSIGKKKHVLLKFD